MGTGATACSEDAAPADGPPQTAGVARAWEAAPRDAPAARQGVLRTAVVLDRGTPALDGALTDLLRTPGGRRA
jgi:NAD dependent epimerase/dehydratase family enzyme